MDDKILVKTILDTEIDVLEGFLDKDREKVLVEDALYVSISDLNQLKGHLDTLKKMREKGWRNWQMMKNDADTDATIAPVMELEYQGRKFENYPGQIENLVKERDNWREMYDEELKKNEELEKELRQKRLELNDFDDRNKNLKSNVEIYCKKYYDAKEHIDRLVKENNELSRINSVRLGDINRLQDKVDKLDGLIDTIDRAYPTVYVNPLRPGYDENITKFCMTCADMLCDWRKL